MLISMSGSGPRRNGRRKGQQLALHDASGQAPALKERKRRKRRRGTKLGRPASGERQGFVAHRARETHDERHPVHVSMRRVRLAPSLREERVYRAIVLQLVRAKRSGVRVVHYDVQDNHLHLIVEGKDREDLSSQMRKLFSRIALAANYVAQRRGALFRDRHHRQELRSPRQTRNALLYVLFNDRKHHAQNGGAIDRAFFASLDERSSIAWLPDRAWTEARPPPEEVARLRARYEIEGEAPIVHATTWLANVGWYERGGGRLSLHELPRLI